jgi:hypothetical protein
MSTAGKYFQSLGRMPARTMNRTEERHAWNLEAKLRCNPQEIIMYGFEVIKLFIGTTAEGKQMWYCPDFLVQLPDRTMEIHEIKGGHITEDSYVKLTAAARIYPQFRFVLFKLTKSGWKRKEIA